MSIYSEAGAYADANPTWHAEDSPYKALKVTEVLGERMKALRSIAEVGCGAGDILRILSEQNPAINFTGYDISPHAHGIAKGKAHERLQFKLKDITLDDSYFDCLLCLDVFEHVDDYLGFLRSIKKRADLKLFNIPLDMNVSAVARMKPIMHAREVVGHLHYFSRETALATLKYCGYEIIDERFNRPFDYSSRWYDPRELADTIRRWGSRISASATARLLGGTQLLVLAR